MFRSTALKTFVLGITSALIFQGCAQPKDTGPITSGQAATLGSLGTSVNASACAAKGDVDTNNDGVCDKDALALGPTCPTDTNCLDPVVPLNKHRKAFFQTGWGQVTLGLIFAATAYGGYVGGTCLGGNCDYWPFNNNDISKPADTASQTNISIPFPDYQEAKIFSHHVDNTPDDEVYMILISQAVLSGNTNFFGKQYGKNVLFCLRNKLVIPASGISVQSPSSATARIQLQGNFENSLEVPDKSGITRDAFEQRCMSEIGALVGLNGADGADDYFVSSAPAVALGFNESSVPGTEVASSDMVFSGLTSISTSQFYFQSLPNGTTAPSRTREYLVSNYPDLTANFPFCDTSPSGMNPTQCKVRDLLAMTIPVNASTPVLSPPAAPGDDNRARQHKQPINSAKSKARPTDTRDLGDKIDQYVVTNMPLLAGATNWFRGLAGKKPIRQP